MRMRFRSCSSLLLFVVVLCLLFSLPAFAAKADKSSPVKTRTYYIAAEEIDWNYTPDEKNMMMEASFDRYERVFTEHAANRIGCTYRKAVFREYTDDSFRTRKSRPPELDHMGLLGPVIRAEVGDTIKVVFRNNASFAFSLHPHGV